ncbi:putative nonsense-mediated mrna decay protein 3 protein [Eutypa lata UCREL1]|uniref:60S ribosomal export protein NMD3 n=1 Tax=Eutypa lata (strain UCR-EL1) TaxID=1287681 RepID=M7SX06_EUTLA|nr:putative nonsense-mediated mrna decay protein 3 protein [Eutypa lata UCREL1]
MSSMDLDTPMPMAPSAQGSMTAATIFCCDCGAPIDGTQSTSARCFDCLKLHHDISEGIQREATLHFCRDCERWLLPPMSWVSAAPESRELLALCLKKLRGLQKVRIVDASFIWTEPHSRRVRVKLTVQDTVSDGVLLQQSFEVIYVVAWQQCPECAKSYTANVWRASVQVRQKVQHKRTFLFLEQLILKHGAHKDTINIKEAKDGIDFLLCWFQYARMTLIGTSINLLDVNTLQTADISAPVYWRAPFTTLAEAPDLVEFVVLDCEPLGPTKGKWVLGELQLARASDFGVNDNTYFARTHLGGMLHAGDSVMGYMLTGTNYNNPQLEAVEASGTYASTIPDVVVVKKHFPNRRRNRRRQWRVKRMAKDEGELLPKKTDQDRMEREFEQFLRDIEEDDEFRQGVQLYKHPKKQQQPDEMSIATTEDDEGDEGDDVPKVDMEELLDDFDELALEEK